MRRLIWAFTVRICTKTHFYTAQPICCWIFFLPLKSCGWSITSSETPLETKLSTCGSVLIVPAKSLSTLGGACLAGLGNARPGMSSSRRVREARLEVETGIEAKAIRMTKIWERYFTLYHSLVKFSRKQTDNIFIFLRKIGFDISCKLSPKETICMNCQSVFSEKKIRKVFQSVICWNFYPVC